MKTMGRGTRVGPGHLVGEMTRPVYGFAVKSGAQKWEESSRGLNRRSSGRETLGCGKDRVAGSWGGKQGCQRVQLPEIKKEQTCKYKK